VDNSVHPLLEVKLDKPWIKLIKVFGKTEGEAVRSYLEANSIPVKLIQESSGELIGSIVLEFGYVDVFIPQDHIKIARTLMEEYGGNLYDKPAGPHSNTSK
jgi:hypothetical protein